MEGVSKNIQKMGDMKDGRGSRVIKSFPRIRMVLLVLLVVFVAGSTGCLNISGGKISVGNIEGIATIKSSPPGAAIYVDNVKSPYVTPSVMKLKAGQHMITLTKQGYLPISTDIDLPFQTTITLENPMKFDQSAFSVGLTLDAGYPMGTVRQFSFAYPDFIEMKKVTYVVKYADKSDSVVVGAAPFTVAFDSENYYGSVMIYGEAEDAYGNKAQTNYVYFTGTGEPPTTP